MNANVAIGAEADLVRTPAEMLGRWRENPVAFSRECLRVEPEAWQERGLRALQENVEDPDAPVLPRIAGKASKGPGKSALEAWIAWWFLLCWPFGKGVATSITGDNLQQNLWAEIAKWQKRSDILLQQFEHNSEKVFQRAHPKLWAIWARTWERNASSEKQAETLAGIHAQFVLALVDESGGVPQAVFSAIEPVLANIGVDGARAWVVQMGNPTQLQGPLYDACTRFRHMWIVLEINGDPDNPERSKRINIEWAREQIREYGRDDPHVRTNVLGQFPLGQSNVLVSADDANRAAQRSVELALYQHMPRIIGVDVARYGEDRTVLQPRQGCVAYRPQVIRTKNTMEIAGQLIAMIERWRPHQVFVDAIGVGAGVVDRCRELGYDVVQGVEFSARPPSKRFLNLRAYAWAEMAYWYRTSSTYTDGDLIREATAPTYKYTSDGKLQLEAKEDVKKRLGISPDKADALALTFSYPVPTPDPIEDNPATRHLVPNRGMRISHEYNPLEGA